MSTSDDLEQRQPLTSETPAKDHAPLPASNASYQSSTATRHRPGYARVPSMSVVDEALDPYELGGDGIHPHPHPRPAAGRDGLGIALSESSSRAEVIAMHPVPKPIKVGDITASPDQTTPGSAKPLMTPPSTGGMSGSTRYDSGYGDFDTPNMSTKHMAKQSHTSLQSMGQQSLYAHSDAGLLSIRSRYDEFRPGYHCRSSKAFRRGRLTWLSVIILVLSVYSTVMSALFLVIALRGPRYGRMIRTDGALTISGATVLTTFFAKTIEISFVTVMVALLGQALARRAHDKNSENGITLAEFSMRSWILQPGTLITHWESVRYAGVTVLGIVSLVAAIMALLYVTAANALVQPQLRFNDWQPQLMQGRVKTAFANPTYIGQDCKTPVPFATDPTDGVTTCLQLEHAAMAYHNYFAWLNLWSFVATSGNGTADLNQRPKGYALLNDNTTITAPWIEQSNSNMTDIWEKHNLIVVNVSMAMPHAGVVGAAMDPTNGIMQPEDLDGLGIYRIHASVPSPVVHVLCATLSEQDLYPFVLDRQNLTTVNTSDYYLGGTPLDEIFGWGQAYGDFKWPPVFPTLPIGFNTMVNDTTGIPYGRDAIYLLGNSTLQLPAGGYAYPLCQLRVSQTPHCATRYNASSSGASLEAVCEDSTNRLQYNASLANATSGYPSLSREWPNIASEWIKSIALNDGQVFANGSNSRLLNQLVPVQPTLNLALPSISEALAVMAGCTLLQSTKDSPFVEFWNYSALSIEPGQYQYFNASIQAQQYASGGTAAYQKAFGVVLFVVFILNLIALIYFLRHRDWYTDVSEPSNLFSLAINSPPSKELAESCGGGPHGDQFRSCWKLQDDGGHLYMESMQPNIGDESPSMRRRRRLSSGVDFLLSPVKRATGTFSERLSR